VQYLSQQFVEQLCSAEGLQDELLAEIERVIFHSHAIDDRMGASSFRELLDIRSTRARNERARQPLEGMFTCFRIPTLSSEWLRQMGEPGGRDYAQRRIVPEYAA